MWWLSRDAGAQLEMRWLSREVVVQLEIWWLSSRAGHKSTNFSAH
jgi:hypothetical protein